MNNAVDTAVYLVVVLHEQKDLAETITFKLHNFIFFSSIIITIITVLFKVSENLLGLR